MNLIEDFERAAEEAIRKARDFSDLADFIDQADEVENHQYRELGHRYIEYEAALHRTKQVLLQRRDRGFSRLTPYEYFLNEKLTLLDIRFHLSVDNMSEEACNFVDSEIEAVMQKDATGYAIFDEIKEAENSLYQLLRENKHDADNLLNYINYCRKLDPETCRWNRIYGKANKLFDKFAASMNKVYAEFDKLKSEGLFPSDLSWEMVMDEKSYEKFAEHFNNFRDLPEKVKKECLDFTKDR